jgi:hypothetical protein
MEIEIGRKKYCDLSELEWISIHSYLENNDYSYLESCILKSHELTLSPGMRRFIADLVTEKIARPAGAKPSVKVRNNHIVKGIFYLMQMGHKLTSGNDVDGAAAIMAKRFGVSEETAKKTYDDLKHDKERIMRPGLEDVEYFNELPEPQQRGRRRVRKK